MAEDNLRNADELFDKMSSEDTKIEERREEINSSYNNIRKKILKRTLGFMIIGGLSAFGLGLYGKVKTETPEFHYYETVQNVTESLKQKKE